MQILIIKNNHTIINWDSSSRSSLVKYQDCMSDAKVELLASKLSRKATQKRFLITLMGLSLYCAKVFAATSAIDKLGWSLLNLVRQWAKPILVVWCLIDVIKSGLSGDAKKTLPILMKYVIIFASMYLIPEIFDAVEQAFKH